MTYLCTLLVVDSGPQCQPHCHRYLGTRRIYVYLVHLGLRPGSSQCHAPVSFHCSQRLYLIGACSRQTGRQDCDSWNERAASYVPKQGFVGEETRRVGSSQLLIAYVNLGADEKRRSFAYALFKGGWPYGWVQFQGRNYASINSTTYI